MLDRFPSHERARSQGPALPESRRGGVVIERRLVFARRGAAPHVHLEQRFRGTGLRAVVAHGAAISADVVVVAGTLAFPVASPIATGAAIAFTAPAHFTFLVPAGAYLPMQFCDALVEARGHATLAGVEAGHELARTAPQREGAPLARVNDRVVDVDAGAPAWLARARARLHDEVAARAPVQILARENGVADATFTRAFTKHYGIGPKEYVQRARVFRAVLALLHGVAVVDSAFTAGFSDVSRFYAQFRRIVGATPGEYSRVRNRQDAPPPIAR